ncbi:MAG: tetratricopeptide repeat protein [Chlorobi bacterium]|nr:tetratricopeptide repeat protein [Chlorobiota bacterium]
MKQLQYFLIAILIFPLALHAQSKSSLDPEAGKLYNAGNAMLKAGNYSGAIEKYRSALSIQEDYRIYYQMGLALKKSGKLDEALAAYENAVRLKPEFHLGYNAIGGVYIIRKNYKKASASYRKALDLKSGFKPAKIGLAAANTGQASLLIKKSSFEKALPLLKEAVEVAPTYGNAYLYLAIVYNKLGKSGQAIDAATKAIKYLKPKSRGAAYFELGVAYRNEGNNAKAREAFMKAKKDPKFARNAKYEIEHLPK